MISADTPRAGRTRKRSLHAQNWKLLGAYGTVGLELALSVLVGYLGGQWLDSKLGTSPWLTLAGFGFGVAAGFRSLFRALRRAQREFDRADREEAEARRKFHDGGGHDGTRSEREHRDGGD
jgi:F0F1-type ATP synthase assembly protein I